MDNEIGLVQKLRMGLPEAYEELYGEYFVSLSVYAFKMVSDPEVAKEIVQEYFIYLWDHKQDLNIKTSLKSYLFQSVHNRCINYLKFLAAEERRREKYSQNLSSDTYHDQLESIEFEKEIYDYIDSLPEQCCRIFKLCRFEQKTYSETAKVLGLSVKTVEVQMGSAFRLVREKFQKKSV
jgi:RNA polymerase sigma-70 factor (ECF subfamily)